MPALPTRAGRWSPSPPACSVGPRLQDYIADGSPRVTNGPVPPSGLAYAGETGTAAAAVSMRFRTSSGWETMATWFDDVSMVVAPIRLANDRSASGGIV